MENGIINLVCIPVILIGYSLILYEGSIAGRLGGFVASYIIFIASEFLCLIMVGFNSDNGNAYRPIIIVDHIIDVALMKILELMLFTVLMILFLTLMLACNVLIFVIFNKYIDNINENSKKQIEIIKQKSKLKYFVDMVEVIENHDDLMHDMTHHLKAIHELAVNKEYERITSLTERLTKSIREVERMIFSRNVIVNAVITEYYNEAVAKGIEVNVNISPDITMCGIEDIDVISVIGNLFDNAIDAAHKVDGRPCISVEMFMNTQVNMCAFKIINDTSMTVRYDDKKAIISSKTIPGKHGLGIKMSEGLLTSIMVFMIIIRNRINL